MAKLNITYAQGALGSVAASQDHISALVFVGDDITDGASGITGISSFTGGHIIQVTSKEGAEAAGITSTAFPKVNYNIANFFEENTTGLVWVAFIEDSGTTYTAELNYIQKFTEGKIRQFGIVDERELDVSVLANIEAGLNALRNLKMPACAIVGMDTSSLNYTTLPDLAAASYNTLAVMVGQDGASTLSGSTSLPEVGAVLGATSAMPVNVSPAYFRLNKYDNITTAPALGNGVEIKSLADSYLEANLDNKNYLRFQKVVGDSSVYLNQSFTAGSRTSDYKSIELNRVIDKAARNINLYLSPELNSPIQLNENGYIAEGRMNELISIAGTGLADMKSNGEISAYRVAIDPTQNILGTNKLEVVVKVIPYATANEIDVTLGYTVSV